MSFITIQKALCAVAIFSLAVTPSYAQTREELAQELAETRAILAKVQDTVKRLEERLDAQDAATTTAQEIPPHAITPQTHTVTWGDSRVQDLEERVNDLEKIADDVDESIGSRSVVSAFDADRFDLGGFFDTSVTMAIGEDNTETSFNRQVFELLAKAKLAPNWDLFVAQAFVRNSPLTFTDPQQRLSPTFADNNSPVKTDTVIAWGQYHHSDLLNVQFGRFITPQGIINIEHFPASLLDTDQPMLLRPFPGQTLFANFTNGVNVYGETYLGDDKLSYAAYAGAWAGNARNAALGGRLAYTLGDSGLTVGLNASSGDRTSALGDDGFQAAGIDILFDNGPFLWKSELFSTSEDSGDDKLAFYLQPGFRITDKLIGFYRYDYFDNGAVGGENVEHVAGLVLNPVDNVRLRAIYRHKLFQDDVGFEDASVDIFQFATTFNF